LAAKEVNIDEMINLLKQKIVWQRLKTTDETLDQKTLLYLFAGLVKNTHRGTHGFLRYLVSSDTPLYLLYPEVLLSGFLLILKREFGSFGTVSSERIQEEVWSSGWKHLLDLEIVKKIQK
jgi:hypothetical protein